VIANIHSGYSTSQVAKLIKVSTKTLYRWLEAGELPPINTVDLGGVQYRVWSEKDLDRARKYRESHYRQKRS
jgi:excisionase family DNA binding protein